jgi:hypothetical protein
MDTAPASVRRAPFFVHIPSLPGRVDGRIFRLLPAGRLLFRTRQEKRLMDISGLFVPCDGESPSRIFVIVSFISEEQMKTFLKTRAKSIGKMVCPLRRKTKTVTHAGFYILCFHTQVRQQPFTGNFCACRLYGDAIIYLQNLMWNVFLLTFPVLPARRSFPVLFRRDAAKRH